MAWRAKKMPLAEWAPFQNAFEEVFLAMNADPDMALFIQAPPEDELSTLFITDRHSDLVEPLSPGQWEDSETPNGKHISFLVGHASAPNDFGIELGLS